MRIIYFVDFLALGRVAIGEMEGNGGRAAVGQKSEKRKLKTETGKRKTESSAALA